MYRHLAFLFLLLHTNRLTAQFIFQNLKEDDGLSSKYTQCMYKDPDGMLWVGAFNGLYRYDGNFVKRYDDPKDEKNITITAIQPIGRGDNLLLGTPNGIRIFKKTVGSYYADERFGAVKNKNILGITRDGFNRLWILCDKEIFIFDGTKVFSAEKVIPNVGHLVDFNFYFQSGGIFRWDPSRHGFWVGGRQCFFIDCQRNMLYDSTNCPFYAPMLSKRSVTSIALDSQQNLWYASLSDHTISYVDFRQKKVAVHHELNGKRAIAGSNLLFVDKHDRLWISSMNFAAYFKEPGKPILKIPYSQDAPYSIAYGHFYDIIEDSENNLWFATINGVSKLAYNSPFKNIYRLPSSAYFLETGFAPINSIAVSDSIIVAAKEDGIIKFNKGGSDFKRYRVSDDTLYKNQFFMAAKVGQDWWCCGAGGVYIIRGNSDKLEKFKNVKKKTSSEFTNFIFSDQKGRVWFQVWNDALYRFDPKTRQLDRFDGNNPRYGIFKYTNATCFVKLHNGNILFSQDGAGFAGFDTKRELFFSIAMENPANFRVNHAVEDKNGNVWFTIFKKGVYKMDPEGHILDSLQIDRDFPFDLVKILAIDSRGAIWGSTFEGLLFMYPGDQKATRVKINLGKTLQDYWTSVCASRDRVYAVMLDHIVEIDPFKFSTTPVVKPPNITSMRVFGKEISDLLRSSIELKSDQDFVTFQYASLYHRDIPSLQYSYQLESIDDSWVHAGRTMTVSYNSLRPGSYLFKVRSTDEHGRWMKQVTAVRIHILPNWWQSWWFFMLVGCVSCVFLYLTYDGYLNRKRKRELSKTIEYFANSVYGENSVNEICWDIARNCTSQLRFEDCSVFLWDNDKQKLVQKASHGAKDGDEIELIDPLEIDLGKGIVGLAGEIKKTVIIPDTSRDTRYIPADKRKLSEIAVPIMHEGKLIGVLDSEHTRRNFFTEEHARALVTIASINANKIAEAQAEDEAAKKELMLLEINRMLAESQLMALRAQMNPHFVFNCLNSIQECIVTQKYGEASMYLNKFSKLFRMVLNNSDRNLVTIEEEKDVLHLYLELEQMRFEQSFVYHIHIDDDLEADEILLPSMLLQPYVENAIWHGLMHKDGYRELRISFEKLDEEVFKCTIDDNGIGRKQSFVIKERNSHTKRHKSKGLQIAKDRLDLIDKQGQHASVAIIDKYDDLENATGTLIVIELSTSLENT